MGQYFRPAFLNSANEVIGAFSPYDTGDGAKLTEHAFIGNRLCLNVVYHMTRSPKRLVWAGDYADTVRDNMNYFHLADDSKLIKPLPDSMLDNGEGNSIYINHDKKEWFDLKKQTVPACSGLGGRFHPLPILTADGNGRGGGDYEGLLGEMVGLWKGDLIEVSDTAPEGYNEIEPWFTEMGQDEVDSYLEGLNRPKMKFTVRTRYTTYEEVTVEAHTEEEALALAEGMTPDAEQIYGNLTVDGETATLSRQTE